MSFDYTSLITDRTQEDVSYLETLTSSGWAEMTDSQRAEWNAGFKGGYNPSVDMNRVQAAMDDLDKRLTGYGYSTGYIPVRDTVWTVNDIPASADLELYRKDIECIRAALNAAPDTPDSIQNLSYEEANDIEKILLSVDDLITRVIANFDWLRCGELYTGEV